MSIPQSYVDLNNALKSVSPFDKPSNLPSIKGVKKSDFNHPFSKAQGLEIKSIKKDYVRAEFKTKLDGSQDNNRRIIHAAVPTIPLTSVMAAVADTNPDPKDKKTSAAFLMRFAQDFSKVIFPGDELEVEAKLESSDKNHRYIVAQIKRGKELVGKAIADFAFLPKEKMGLAA